MPPTYYPVWERTVLIAEKRDIPRIYIARCVQSGTDFAEVIGC